MTICHVVWLDALLPRTQVSVGVFLGHCRHVANGRDNASIYLLILRYLFICCIVVRAIILLGWWSVLEAEKGGSESRDRVVADLAVTERPRARHF